MLRKPKKYDLHYYTGFRGSVRGVILRHHNRRRQQWFTCVPVLLAITLAGCYSPNKAHSRYLQMISFIFCYGYICNYKSVIRYSEHKFQFWTRRLRSKWPRKWPPAWLHLPIPLQMQPSTSDLCSITWCHLCLNHQGRLLPSFCWQPLEWGSLTTSWFIATIPFVRQHSFMKKPNRVRVYCLPNSCVSSFTLPSRSNASYGSTNTLHLIIVRYNLLRIESVYLVFLLYLVTFRSQQGILTALRRSLPSLYPFQIVDEHIDVISGKWEGVYSWIAVNYILGSFDHTGHHYEEQIPAAVIDSAPVDTQSG